MSAGADLAISSYLWLKNDLIVLLAGQPSLPVDSGLQPGLCRCWLVLSTQRSVTALASITKNAVLLEIGTGVIKLQILR